MAIYWLLALMAGLAGVIQSGFTKKLADRAGLANTLHVSNFVVLIGGLVILTLILKVSNGEFAKVLRGQNEFKFSEVSWWFIVPGLCGLFMITVAPLALGEIGALPVFVSMIFGQVLGSAAWDWKIEGAPLDRYRIAGLILSLASAIAIALSGSTGEAK